MLFVIIMRCYSLLLWDIILCYYEMFFIIMRSYSLLRHGIYYRKGLLHYKGMLLFRLRKGTIGSLIHRFPNWKEGSSGNGQIGGGETRELNSHFG